MLMNLVSSYPDIRLKPLNAVQIILTYLYYNKKSSVDHVSDSDLLSTLMTLSADNTSRIDWTSLYFHTLCTKEDIISAGEYISNHAS